MYKYNKINIDVNDVVFLEVIKNPFWHNHEERLFNNENLEQLCCHNYVDDVIDSGLDQSQSITYCIICEIVKN